MQVVLAVAAMADAVLMLVVAWAIIRTAKATEKTAMSVAELRKQAEMTNVTLNRMAAVTAPPKPENQEPSKAQPPGPIPGTPW